MRRYKWYKAAWPHSLRSMTDAMLKEAYDPDLGYGFRLDKVRENYIQGEYIERRKYEDVVEDPLGGFTSIERFTYDIARFYITNSPLAIELIDPPRRSTTFFSAISNANYNKVSINPIAVDLDRWLNKLEVSLKGFIVTYLVCSGISMSSRTSAKVVLQGSEDVRRHLMTVAKNKTFRIERARFLCRGERGETVVEISRLGSAKVKSKDVPFIMPTLKESLTSVIGPT